MILGVAHQRSGVRYSTTVIGSGFLLVLMVLTAGCYHHRREDIEFLNIPVLDRDRVEKAALRGQWSDITRYLGSMELGALGCEERAYAFYWLGAGAHFQGEPDRAQQNWSRAAGLPMSPDISQKLALALKKSPGQVKAGGPGATPRMQEPMALSGKWIIQLGLFKVKKSADDLFSDLNWKGHPVKVDRLVFKGVETWMVWVGPFEHNRIEREERRLNDLGFSTLVKPHVITP